MRGECWAFVCCLTSFTWFAVGCYFKKKPYTNNSLSLLGSHCMCAALGSNVCSAFA